MLKNERVKWYQANLRAECGAKSWFKAEEAINFLKAEGFVITFSEFKDLAMRLYQKDERGTFCDLEVIGFIGRLSLDEEI